MSMNNNQCPRCQEFLYETKQNNQDCQRYMCPECGNVTFLTFQHQTKEPGELMILTNRQYRSLHENVQHLKRIPEKKTCNKY